ncbi:hypothetical protein PUN28_007758 [Cardiocondyla obscurior]|uniref:Uncharacterized protein n=1 Tax=Cardiocondyla obscurior TaxID=286306 RepID=A0AAW2FZL4_9HYME
MTVINGYMKTTLWFLISLVYLVCSEQVFTARNVNDVDFSKSRLATVLPYQLLNDDSKKLGVQNTNAKINELEIDRESIMDQANNIQNINVIQKIKSEDWEKINSVLKSDEIKLTELSNIAEENENHNRYQRCITNIKKKPTKNLLKVLIALIKKLSN